MTDERRAFQRLDLTRPVEGAFGGVPLQIVEVSARGVLATTDRLLQRGARGVVRFQWRGETIEADAAVAWCENGRAGFRLEEVPEVLRRLIEDSVTELLKAQEVRDYTPNVVDEESFPVADIYVIYTLDDGVWTRRASLLPDQPPNGFTIAQSEPADHVELLCRTFERGDAETRRLTRLFAELSVTRSPLIR